MTVLFGIFSINTLAEIRSICVFIDLFLIVLPHQQEWADCLFYENAIKCPDWLFNLEYCLHQIRDTGAVFLIISFSIFPIRNKRRLNVFPHHEPAFVQNSDKRGRAKIIFRPVPGCVFPSILLQSIQFTANINLLALPVIGISNGREEVHFGGWRKCIVATIWVPSLQSTLSCSKSQVSATLPLLAGSFSAGMTNSRAIGNELNQSCALFFLWNLFNLLNTQENWKNHQRFLFYI